VGKEGYILTNYHVVQGANIVDVTLQDGRKFKAEVKGHDARSDLAVIKIDAKNLPISPLGDSNGVKTGQWVMAIGNPFGYLLKDNQLTVTVGVVSATHRKLPDIGLGAGPYYFDLIQTDAAINPGNSGGPLVNLKGEVVGINLASFSTSGGYQGLGFAIPINVAKEVLKDLIDGSGIFYGWLGVGVGPVDARIAKEMKLPDQKGALVLKVFEGSAAEKYQLKELDVIRKLGTTDINSPEDLIQEVAKLRSGTSVRVEGFRKGQPIAVDIVLGSHPSEKSKTAP
jgi:serine protease Do